MKQSLIGWDKTKAKPAGIAGKTMKNQLMNTQVGRVGSEVQMRRLQELEKAPLGVFTVDLEFGNT